MKLERYALCNEMRSLVGDKESANDEEGCEGVETNPVDNFRSEDPICSDLVYCFLYLHHWLAVCNWSSLTSFRTLVEIILSSSMIWWYCLSSRDIRFGPMGILLLASPFTAIIRENVLFNGDREISVLFAIGYELLSPGSWWGRGRFSGETSGKKVITYKPYWWNVLLLSLVVVKSRWIALFLCSMIVE